jgi:1-acyl-sn-glycerol-3-phosphate acyltransferase
MINSSQRFHTPGRKLIRSFLHWLSRPAFAALTDLEINGTENLPSGGPLIMVGNHFSFIDPV